VSATVSGFPPMGATWSHAPQSKRSSPLLACCMPKGYPPGRSQPSWPTGACSAVQGLCSPLAPSSPWWYHRHEYYDNTTWRLLAGFQAHRGGKTAMPKRGRPFEYQTDEDRPVTVSLRIPKDLYNQMETYRRMHQQSITELLLDGLRMRLDTPADPRDLLMSDDNTVIQELEEMVDARVQAALARMGGAMLPHSLAASPLAESYVQQASHIAEPVPQAHTPDVPGDRVPSTKAGLVEDFPGHDIPES